MSSRAGPDNGGFVRLIIPEDDGLRMVAWHQLRLRCRVLCGDQLLILWYVLCCLGNKNRILGLLQGIGELDVFRLT